MHTLYFLLIHPQHFAKAVLGHVFQGPVKVREVMYRWGAKHDVHIRGWKVGMVMTGENGRGVGIVRSTEEQFISVVNMATEDL